MHKRLLTIAFLYGSLITAAAETQDGTFSYWTKDTWHVGLAEKHTRVHNDYEKEIYYVRDAQRPYYAYAKVKDKKQEGIEVLCKTEVRDGMVLFGMFESAHRPTLDLVANGLFKKIDAQKMRTKLGSSENIYHLRDIFASFASACIKQEEIELNGSDEEASFQAFKSRICKTGWRKHKVAVELVMIKAYQEHPEEIVQFSGVHFAPYGDRGGHEGSVVCGFGTRLWSNTRTDLKTGFRGLAPEVLECMNSITDITTAVRNLARLTAEEYDALCDPTYKIHMYALLDVARMKTVAKESLMRMRSQQKQSMRAKEVIYRDIQGLFQEPVTDDEVKACIGSAN